MALDTRLVSVTIVYCKNDQLFEKEIDLERAGGLWWNNGTAANKGNNYVPGRQTPLHKDCPMVQRGASACWWDNQKNDWVCPDGLGG